MKQINLGAIYHMPWLEYRHAAPDGRIVIPRTHSAGRFQQGGIENRHPL